MAAVTEFNQQEEILINEEYKLWKKQASQLYDLMFSQGLDWPTMSFEWMPSIATDNEDTPTYRALITSNAGDKDQCYLHFVNIRLNGDKEERNIRNSRRVEKEETIKRFEVATKIPHNGEVNRARHNPLNPNMVAAKGLYGDIHVFDIGNEENKDNTSKPLFKLVGHKQEGYGIMWNPIDNGILLSGSYDRSICIWDIEGKRTTSSIGTQKVESVATLSHHNAAVEDVAWHRFHSNIFASCSDDRTIAVWDRKFRHSEGKAKPALSVVAHRSEIYSIDFSPFHEYLLVSGSQDKEVKVWDMRKMSKNVCSFLGHDKNVLKVQWSPFNLGVIASCSGDRRVNIWDMGRIGEGEKKTGQVFSHQGHRSRVPDFDWHPTQKLMVGSVEEGNILQVWEMSKTLYYENEEDTK